MTIDFNDSPADDMCLKPKKNSLCKYKIVTAKLNISSTEIDEKIFLIPNFGNIPG
jgi:hypothetical protein